jgi:MFS family permease
MGISIGLAKMGTSLYSLKLGADETMLGFISGAQMIGIMVMGLPVGFWVDRIGPTPLFLLGSLLGAVGYATIPQIPTLEFLLLCTALISFVMPLRFISLNTIFMRQLDMIGESKAGWYRGSHMIGMFLIGPVIVPPLIAYFEFKGVFYLIAIIFVATIVMSPIVLKHYGEKTAAARQRSSLKAQLGLIFKHAGLQEVCLIEFFCHGMNTFYTFFIVVIAINQLKLDTATATGLVAIQGFAYILALLLMGVFTSRLGQKKSYLSSFLLICLSLALLGNSTSLSVLWLGSALLGLSSGTLEVVNLTRFARIGSEMGQGKVAAINGLAGPFGMLCASLGGGQLGYYLGLPTVFTLFIPIWLILTLRLLRSEAAQQPAQVKPRYALQFANTTMALIPLPVMALFPECFTIILEIEQLKHTLFLQQALKE